MDTLGLIALVAAVVTSGILAGAFLLYAHTVMPALRAADDATFVDTFARLDRAIVNPVFMLTAFLGAPMLTALAAVFALDAESRWWILAAFVLHLVMVMVTGAVNVPLNNALTGAPPDADPAALRAAFDEPRWSRWNLVRVFLSTGALGLLAWALVVSGAHR